MLPTPLKLFSTLIFLTILHQETSVLAKSSIKFRTWGEPCKTGPTAKPQEDCENSKGIYCEQYTQGYYCGCPIKGILSWDKGSGECRRKVGDECFYSELADDDWKSLGFNHKCHDRMECVKLNLTALSGKKTQEEKSICQCREGFVASKNFAECLHPNRQSSSLASTIGRVEIVGIAVICFMIGLL